MTIMMMMSKGTTTAIIITNVDDPDDPDPDDPAGTFFNASRSFSKKITIVTTST
jgi:hypothetical protein